MHFAAVAGAGGPKLERVGKARNDAPQKVNGGFRSAGLIPVSLAEDPP
jgi:hypothetical protein